MAGELKRLINEGVTRKPLTEVVSIGSEGRGWCIDFHWRPVAHDRLVNGKGKALTQPHGGTWGQDAVECVGITLRSFALPGKQGAPDPIAKSAEPSALTTGLIRRVNWGQQIDLERRTKVAPLLRELAARYRRVPPRVVRAFRAKGQPPPLSRTASRLGRQAIAMEENRAPEIDGRRKYAPAHYEAVAAIYEESYHATGSHGSPTKAVAQHFDVPRARAAKWVARARSTGLITVRAPQGRPRKGEEGQS